MVRVVSVRVTSRENATLPGIIMEVETHRFAKENGFRGHAIHVTMITSRECQWLSA